MKAFRITGRDFQCLEQRPRCLFFPAEGVQSDRHLIVGAGQVMWIQRQGQTALFERLLMAAEGRCQAAKACVVFHQQRLID